MGNAWGVLRDWLESLKTYNRYVRPLRAFLCKGGHVTKRTVIEQFTSRCCRYFHQLCKIEGRDDTRMRCFEMRLKLAAITKSSWRMLTEPITRPGKVVVPPLMLEPVIFSLETLIE